LALNHGHTTATIRRSQPVDIVCTSTRAFPVLPGESWSTRLDGIELEHRTLICFPSLSLPWIGRIGLEFAPVPGS
jgi:hypothetical protein